MEAPGRSRRDDHRGRRAKTRARELDAFDFITRPVDFDHLKAQLGSYPAPSTNTSVRLEWLLLPVRPPTNRVGPRSGKGHEDQFRQSTPSGCCVKRKSAVVGIHWNGRDAPICGRSQWRAGTEMLDAQGTLVAAHGIVELQTKRSSAPDRVQAGGWLTPTRRAVSSLLSDRWC